MMMAKKSGLPSEYQEVEWISTSGRFEYLDTGVIPTNEIVFEIRDTTTYHIKRYTFGSSEKYCYKWNGNQVTVYMGDVSWNPYWIDRYKATRTLKFDAPNGQILDDDVVEARGTPNINETNTLKLFNVSNPTETSFIGNIYYAKFTENNYLIRDFIPCYRKSDGVIGMYDLCGSICPLTNTPFYINAGTGTFTKGPDVN